MRRLRKWLIILAVLGAIGWGARSALQSWWKKSSTPQFLTAKVSRGRVETVVNSTGTVKPALSVSVGAFTSGPIKEVLVDFNSKVKKGDTLALIDPRLTKAVVDRDMAFLKTQEAEQIRADALLELANNNLARADKLKEINDEYISKQDYNQLHTNVITAVAQVALAKASVKQAEATLKNSQANLDYTTISAPVDGIVIERKVDPGQTVAASFQTPELFVIAPKMDEYMHIFASVDEADIGMIRAAKERNDKLHRAGVTFTVDAYPGKFEGTIDQIRLNPTTTQNVVTYPVIIKAPNKDLKLMPGMTASISFEVEVRENVLRVPAAALRFVPLPAQVRPEDQHYVTDVLKKTPDSSTKRTAGEKAELNRSRQNRLVWVQDGELLRAVPVTLGVTEPRFAEVLKGDLTEDQEVVTGTESKTGPR
jgi:HlyD family secretion protein